MKLMRLVPSVPRPKLVRALIQLAWPVLRRVRNAVKLLRLVDGCRIWLPVWPKVDYKKLPKVTRRVV